MALMDLLTGRFETLRLESTWFFCSNLIALILGVKSMCCVFSSLHVERVGLGPRSIPTGSMMHGFFNAAYQMRSPYLSKNFVIGVRTNRSKVVNLHMSPVRNLVGYRLSPCAGELKYTHVRYQPYKTRERTLALTCLSLPPKPSQQHQGKAGAKPLPRPSVNSSRIARRHASSTYVRRMRAATP